MGKKKNIDVTKVFGIGSSMLQAMADLANEIKSQNGNQEDIRHIERNADLRQKIAGLIVEAGKSMENIFKLTVYYSKPLDLLIEAGNYGSVDKNINLGNFLSYTQSWREEEVEIELLHPGRDFENTDEAIAWINKQGYRPANLFELLTLGAKRPELQMQFPIVALGPAFNDQGKCHDYPCLSTDSGSDYMVNMRKFELFWKGAVLIDQWRLAAVKKTTS